MESFRLDWRINSFLFIYQFSVELRWKHPDFRTILNLNSPKSLFYDFHVWYRDVQPDRRGTMPVFDNDGVRVTCLCRIEFGVAVKDPGNQTYALRKPSVSSLWDWCLFLPFQTAVNPQNNITVLNATTYNNVCHSKREKLNSHVKHLGSLNRRRLTDLATEMHQYKKMKSYLIFLVWIFTVLPANTPSDAES